MRAALVAVALAAAGCGYHASFVDCQVACSTGCPDGLVCGGEGYCRLPGAVASCNEVQSDAGGVTRVDVLNARATPSRDLDVLFVIDDSLAMTDKQDRVKAALPALFAELAKLDGGLPNLHVGVVSSDMGTKGSAVATPGPGIGTIGQGGCSGLGKAGNLTVNGAPVTKAFLEDVAAGSGARERNYTGELAAVVGTMISLGEGGCGFEQHLAAMRAALSGNPMNAGFLRPDAGLAVIVVADEDDCSILDPAVLGPESAALGPLQSFRCFQFGDVCEPDDPTTLGAKTGCRPRPSSLYIEDLASFRTFLAGLKPDPRDVMLGVIGGPPTPVTVELERLTTITNLAVANACSYVSPEGATGADPAIRFDALLQSFPGRTRFAAVCDADLAPAMTAMAQTARPLAGDTCLELAIADSAAAPGVQGDCFVDDVVGAVRTPIQACGSNTFPCWDLVEDAVACPTQSQHLKLVVTRNAPSPTGGRVVARCAAP